MSHANDDRPRRQGPAVEALRLTLTHGAHPALVEATFTIPRGQATVLVGPNGSGKSTVLDAVAGLLPPAAGHLHVHADDIAYVPQHLHASPHLPITVAEVVTMARYAARGPLGRLDATDREAVRRAMDRLEVAHLARRQHHDLSGGERQRVLVAQALAQEAEMLLLDEALTGLDLPSQERITEALDDERSRGRTIVASTHSLNEALLADHVLLLAGRVVAAGAPTEVLTEENLAAAYGEMVVDVGTNRLILDDPHHH